MGRQPAAQRRRRPDCDPRHPPARHPAGGHGSRIALPGLSRRARWLRPASAPSASRNHTAPGAHSTPLRTSPSLPTQTGPMRDQSGSIAGPIRSTLIRAVRIRPPAMMRCKRERRAVFSSALQRRSTGPHLQDTPEDVSRLGPNWDQFGHVQASGGPNVSACQRRPTPTLVTALNGECIVPGSRAVRNRGGWRTKRDQSQIRPRRRTSVLGISPASIGFTTA